jgi:AraC family transcriptional regulator, transcriptional activator of pobA
MNMKQNYKDIRSIGDVHRLYNCGKPKHPLITVIDLKEVNRDRSEKNEFFRTGFYNIMCKRFDGSLKYGRSVYDFEEGTLMFTAPNQVISSSSDTRIIEGWGLFFHPDLLAGTELGKKIHQYTFFQYDANEALHISEEEKITLKDCLDKIKREYDNNIDRHTNDLIVDILQLILNYCSRFYDRQFYTRKKVSTDILQRFERLLWNYFSDELNAGKGIPDVGYFAAELNLSPNYLSDLLSKYTGKSTLEHIHLHLVEKAKELLWGSESSVSEIAYGLGFEHLSHFTRFFKNKTGHTPRDFRSLN